MAAREMLILRNMRLVAHIVKKYQCPENEQEELISIGTIGLIKAIATVDAEKGRLSTYAARCIENELLMYFRSRKKISKEVSYYEPIGTDKEGNEISLLDIIESQDRSAFEVVTAKEDGKDTGNKPGTGDTQNPGGKPDGGKPSDKPSGDAPSGDAPSGDTPPAESIKTK